MAYTDEDVRRLIADNGGGQEGLAKVETAFREERYSGDRAKAVGAFLQGHREQRAAEAQVRDQGLMERGVRAAESQADTAKEALERSNWAIAISIFAALVAVVDLLTRH